MDEGPNIPLNKSMILIGRHAQCDARLDSERVSRRHCMINVGDEVIVRDLGSTNGIRLNGQRVEQATLKHNDELSIAHIRFRYESALPVIQVIVTALPRDAASQQTVPGEASPIALPADPNAGQKPTAPDAEAMPGE